MQCMRKCLLLITFLTCGLNCNTLFSQSLQVMDSTLSEPQKRGLIKRIYEYFERSNEVNNEKRFDISFIGGPSYSNDTKLGIGLVASGLYRLDREDLSISPSNISIYSTFSTSGFYALGVEGNTIFPKEKYRLDMEMFFSSMPSKYWGIGYERGRQEDHYTKYTNQKMQVKLDFLIKIARYTYLGVTGTAQNIKGLSFKNRDFLGNEKRENTAVGGGLIVSYDSRDFIPNPYRGLYIKIEQNFYPKFLGSTYNFNRTNIIARGFQEVWKNAILAGDIQGIFNSGDVPWSMTALLGSSYQMRGYFNGQYRDKKIVQAQVELRQRIYKRSGIAIWAGAGNVFPDFDQFEWDQTLPTFGVGYRWEFKNRVNIRLDYGIGKGQSGFYFNINEAF